MRGKQESREERERGGSLSEGQPRLGGFPEDRLFDTPALTLQCI